MADFTPLVFPASDYSAYCALDILQFLHSSGVTDKDASDSLAPVVFISFSAGVVGAIGAAWQLQFSQNRVKAFLAIDGWGVPLYGNFPIHRISHDYFTHWSSALLGAGEEGFYADPGVGHLQMWRSPQEVWGWQMPPAGMSSDPERITALAFIARRLSPYGIAGDRHKGKVAPWGKLYPQQNLLKLYGQLLN
jgi:hypothetical protein